MKLSVDSLKHLGTITVFNQDEGCIDPSGKLTHNMHGIISNMLVCCTNPFVHYLVIESHGSTKEYLVLIFNVHFSLVFLKNILMF